MDKKILIEPPALIMEKGTAKSCVVYNGVDFTSYFNKYAWFGFRLSLWHLATSLSPGEDIGIYSGNGNIVFSEAVIVPYCEITLLHGDQPAGRFLKIKRNYTYRPDDRRVDFSVVRPEAEEAFLNFESLGESNQKIKLFDNLWAQIVDIL